MKKLIVALAAVVALAGCSTAEKDAAMGGVGGAIVGGLITGDAGGALVGGAIGAAGTVLVGQATRRGWCVYRDSRGRLYEARCRAGCSVPPIAASRGNSIGRCGTIHCASSGSAAAPTIPVSIRSWSTRATRPTS